MRILRSARWILAKRGTFYLKSEIPGGFSAPENAENTGNVRPFLCIFFRENHVVFMALGCSISMPDISQ